MIVPLTNELYQALRPASRHFVDLCFAMIETHLKKAHDYGSDTDPLGNFQSARRLGLSPSRGIFLRMQDKMSRIESFCTKNVLMNESIHDTLLDLANYSLLADVTLHQETTEADLGGT